MTLHHPVEHYTFKYFFEQNKSIREHSGMTHNTSGIRAIFTHKIEWKMENETRKYNLYSCILDNTWLKIENSMHFGRDWEDYRNSRHIYEEDK